MLPKLLCAFRRLLRDEDGPTAVEYAIMLALIIVVCVTAITTLGSNAAASFAATDAAIANAETTSS